MGLRGNDADVVARTDVEWHDDREFFGHPCMRKRVLGTVDSVSPTESTESSGGGSPRVFVKTLAPEAASAAVARNLVREACERWRRRGLCDSMELLTTELVANAVRYAGAAISVRILATSSGVRVEVSDDSPRRPVQRDPDPYAESGRGLWLVDALADRWGVDAHPAGKRVWAEVVEANSSN